MELNSRQFPKFDKEAVEAEIRQRSADYAASQPKEVNQGWLHSGVNQFTYNSYNNPSFKLKANGSTLAPKD